MLMLSQSQAKNYFKKLKSSSYDEECGCCNYTINYQIKGNRILQYMSGLQHGSSYCQITILAKIKKVRK